MLPILQARELSSERLTPLTQVTQLASSGRENTVTLISDFQRGEGMLRAPRRQACGLCSGEPGDLK